MRKPVSIITASLLSAAFILLACEKKRSEGIAPTYGTTGNPNPGHQTVTGTTTSTNPATTNTSLRVEGGGWSNPTCPSTNSVMLKGVNGATEVILSFATTMKTATYAIAATPQGNSACAMTVLNAPGQPAGTVWYGQSGQVVVNTTTASINASFSNVVCTQKTFNFPMVTVSGALSCGL
jgi:hypothetical protein